MQRFANFFNFNKKKKLRELRQERWDRLDEQKPKKLRERLNNPYFASKKRIPRDGEKIEFNLKKFLKNEGWVYLSIIGVFIALSGYIIFGTGFLTLNQVQVQGNENITEDELKGLVGDVLASKLLYIVPLNNFLTFQPASAEALIYDEISNQFALEDLEITKKFPHTVEVIIDERIPGLTWSTQNKLYYIDPEGYITQSLASEDKADEQYPKIIDQNDQNAEMDEQVISAELIDFILLLEDNLTEVTHLGIEAYSIPQIQCQEKEYIMEKVFIEEISDTEDEETKAKKKEVQEKFKAGEIDVDESLEMLEQIKTEEKKKNKKKKKNTNENEDEDDGPQESVIWEAVYKPVECDFIKINTEINVLVPEEDGGFEIYFDSKLDLDQQLNNLNSLINEKIDDRSKITYIDLRFPDRIYYK